MSNTKEDLLRKSEEQAVDNYFFNVEDSMMLHALFAEIRKNTKATDSTMPAVLHQLYKLRRDVVALRLAIEQLREDLLPMPKDVHTACGCAECLSKSGRSEW
jgi:hypothetical protein